MIENLINELSQNPMFLAVAIVLVLLVVYSMVKRLMKLTIVIVILMAGYIGYLVWSEQEVPSTIEEMMEHVGGKMDAVTTKAGEVVEGVKEKVSETVKEVMEEKVDSLFKDFP